MKSVLRSAFEPVPRPLSPGAQLLVVGVLIVGIAISVIEYVESSRPAALAEDGQIQPARIETRIETSPSSPKPVVLGAGQRSVVRTTPHAGAVATEPAAASACEPSTGSGAPMAVQPGEDG